MFLLLLPDISRAEDAAVPAKRTPQSSNIVLGRDLIATTKSVEDLSLRLRLVQSLRSELERVRSAFDQTTKGRSADSAKQTKLALQIKELQSKLDSFRAEVNQADAKASRKPKNPQLNPQPVDGGAVQAPEPAQPAAVPPPPPPGDDAPVQPGAESAPGEPGTTADATRLLELELHLARQILETLKGMKANPETAPDAAPDESAEANTDEFYERLNQYGNELGRIQRAAHSERLRLITLEAKLASLEDDMRSVELRIDAAQLPILQGAPLIGGFLPIGTGMFGSDAPQAPRSEAAPETAESNARPVSDNPWTNLRWFASDLQRDLEIVEEEIPENEEREAKLAERVQTLSKRMVDIEARFTDITTRLQKDLDAANALKTDTEETLSARDDKYNQHQINLWLVWAVLLMAGAIPALFLLFRFYQPPILALLVNERLFIEILSMAFLLLAIIILGTGSIITGEGLAGLLGTIAGYIFARKTLENRRDGQANADDLAAAIAAQEEEVRRLESLAGEDGNDQRLAAIDRRLQDIEREMRVASPEEKMDLREERAQLRVERERLASTRQAQQESRQEAGREGGRDANASQRLRRAREELEMLKSVARRRRRE